VLYRIAVKIMIGI